MIILKIYKLSHSDKWVVLNIVSDPEDLIKKKKQLVILSSFLAQFPVVKRNIIQPTAK